MTSESNIEDHEPTDEAGEPSMDPVQIEEHLASIGISEAAISALPEADARRICEIAAARQEAEDARVRALADFRNYQRRSIENESRARRDGMSGFAKSLFSAIDHFDLALQSADSSSSVESFAEGIGIVRREIGRALESCGITEISPTAGAVFEPGKHESIGVMPGEAGLDPGTVAATVAVGYALDEIVLRPARVMLVAEAS